MISFNPAAAQKRLSVQNYPGNYKYQKSDKSCSQLGFNKHAAANIMMVVKFIGVTF